MLLHSPFVSRYRALFEQRGYAWFFAGTSLAMAGTGIRFVAFTWMAMELTQNASSAMWVLLSETLPGILLSPFLGLYVDRVDRRIVMTQVCLFGALALLPLPLMSWFRLQHVWILYLVAFLMALNEVIFRATTAALTRELIPPAVLLDANSTTVIANQIGLSIGALIAGLIIAWASSSSVILVYIVLLLLAAGTFWRVRSERISPSAHQRPIRSWSMLLAEVGEGARYIRAHPHVIPLYIVMLTFIFILRTINLLLPSFSKYVLQVGSRGFGYIDAAYAVGAFCGSLSLPYFKQRYGQTVVPVGMAGLIGSLTLFALSVGLKSAVIAYFLIGMTYQVFILFSTQAQMAVDVGYQGRVNSTFTLFAQVMSLVIYAGMGLLGTIVSQRWLYVTQSAVVLCVWLLVYRWLQAVLAEQPDRTMGERES